jgi:hypothetical protein
VDTLTFCRLEELLISAQREYRWFQNERRAQVEKVLRDGSGDLGYGENRPTITWLLEDEI